MSDFNRDGVADVVVTNYGSGNVSVLLGNGDGTFEPARSFGADNGPALVGAFGFQGASSGGNSIAPRVTSPDFVVR